MLLGYRIFAQVGLVKQKEPFSEWTKIYILLPAYVLKTQVQLVLKVQAVLCSLSCLTTV